MVVARAMAKEPDARFPSAGDLGRAARAAVSGGSPSQPERMVARGAAAPGGAPREPGLAAEISTITATRPARAATPTARVVKTIRHVGLRPNGIAVARGDLWVTSFEQPWVTRIDAATGRERHQHPRVGLGSSAVVTAGGSVWVAAKEARRVVRIDARTGHVTKKLDPGGPPARLAVGLGSLWVGTRSSVPGEDVLVRYSLDGRELRRIPMPGGVDAVTTGAGAVWVAQLGDPVILRVEPSTGKTVVWLTLNAQATALSYGGGHLWASLNSADSISRIKTDRLGSSLTTAVGHRPTQAIMAGDRVFLGNTTDHTVDVLDPRTTLPTQPPLRVGFGPYAIAAGEGAVWVTGIGENTVTRIEYR